MCIICYHTDEYHMDVVANIILVVESEKRVISGHSSFVTIVENYFFSHENLGSVDHTAPVYRIVTGIVDCDTHSRLSLGLVQLLKTATSEEEHMRNIVYN